MNINKVVLVGNITKEIELKSLPSGQKVAQFSLATNRIYKDAQGNRREDAEFHNIVVFGKQAESSAQYLVKGQNVLIEGRIQTRSWEDKNGGGKKYRTEIIAENVQFGTKPSGSPSKTGSNPNAKPENDQSDDFGARNASAVKSSVEEHIDYGEDVNPDDIPF